MLRLEAAQYWSGLSSQETSAHCIYKAWAFIDKPKFRATGLEKNNSLPLAHHRQIAKTRRKSLEITQTGDVQSHQRLSGLPRLRTFRNFTRSGDLLCSPTQRQWVPVNMTTLEPNVTSLSKLLICENFSGNIGAIG